MVKIKVENINQTEAVENNSVNEESASDNEVKEEIIEPQTAKKTPQQKMVSCPNCGKEMLQKTFRYYHSLKCKPHQEEPAPTVPPKPDKIEVNFDVVRKVGNTGNIQRLISRAF